MVLVKLIMWLLLRCCCLYSVTIFQLKMSPHHSQSHRHLTIIDSIWSNERDTKPNQNHRKIYKIPLERFKKKSSLRSFIFGFFFFISYFEKVKVYQTTLIFNNHIHNRVKARNTHGFFFDLDYKVKQQKIKTVQGFSLFFISRAVLSPSRLARSSLILI